MKYQNILCTLLFGASTALWSWSAAAGRYDGLADVFNKAAKGGGVSDTFNKASGSASLPNKGDLTYIFNKSANPPNTHYNNPQPTYTPIGGPPNNAPNY